MNAETLKVDVLSAMKRASQVCEGEGAVVVAFALENAGDAVCELIAAAREVTAAFRAIGNDRTIVAPAGLVKRAEEAMARLDLASNRIGGVA